MGFTQIDNSLFEDERLTIQAQSLLFTLIRYYNKEKGYAFPSVNDIKKASKIKDPRTLKSAIESLTEIGYLKKTTIKGRGCRYYLNLFPNKDSVDSHIVENCTMCNITPTHSVDLHHGIVENYTTTKTKTKTKTRTNMHDAEFEEFFSIYPNPVNKDQTYRNWIKCIRKDSAENILKATRNYINHVESKNTNEDYIIKSTNFVGQEQKYKEFVNYQETKATRINQREVIDS